MKPNTLETKSYKANMWLQGIAELKDVRDVSLETTSDSLRISIGYIIKFRGRGTQLQ
jgi:cobalamin biosynthesis Co2+ chelatase CbiK